MTSKDKKFPWIMGVHASYTQHKTRSKNDLVVVKEKRVDDKGNVTNGLRMFENYQRDFYITKPRYRDHKSKKEWEALSKLTRVKTTQGNLINAVAKGLNTRRGGLRTMARSPYLYGADVHVSTIILHRYLETYGDSELLPTVGVMDYEWDIDTKSPSVGTYVFEDTIYLTVRRDKLVKCGYSDNTFLRLVNEGFKDGVVPLLDKFFDDNPKVEKHNYNLRVEIVDLDLDVVRALFKHTHTTMPDYLAFWGGSADMKVIMALCESYMCDPATFMCDPSIPEPYRNTSFKEGPTETIDANGNKKTKKPSEQWHELLNLASWQFIDIMCSYHTNRAHKPDLPSYAMNNVLPREINLGKLKLVAELDELEVSDQVAWHNKMANEHILEYSLYAIGDVTGPMLMELKNFEIRAQAYSNLTYHPIGDFKKNPRKLCNAQHFSFLKHGFVVGTTSDRMREELDDKVYGSSDWIITLNSSYHDTLETPALSDSNIDTLYIPANDDSDLTSSYPSNQRLLNMAKATTVTELIKVVGIPEILMREIGLNLSSCGDNSIDIAHRLLDLPHLSGVLALWDSQ